MTQHRRVVGRWPTQRATEASRARRGGGVDSARSGLDPGEPLLAEPRLLSLQSTAGNRAVTALVQRWRDEPGAAGLLQRRFTPIQRMLLVNGTWYGQDDEEQLKALKDKESLPEWKPLQLKDKEHFYVMNAERSGWVEDTQFMFMRFRDGTKRVGNAKTGLSSHDPYSDVKLSDTGAERVGPKHPELRTVSRVSLYLYDKDLASAHWMLQCDVEGGGKGQKKNMKIDLTKDGYRIMYGAAPQVKKGNADQIDFDLEGPAPVRHVYNAFVTIAQQKGRWTGTHDYNCQDFAIAMLRQLKVKQQERLEQQVDWRRKNKPLEKID